MSNAQPNDVRNMSLPVVKSQNELTNALAQLSKHYNVLIPPQMNFAQATHKVALEAVYIDPTVDDKNNGVDIYSVDRGVTFTLHGRAANKIAAAAGVIWVDSRIVKRDVDPKNSRVVYVEHQVRWRVKRPNGTTREGITTGKYSFAEDQSRFGDKQSASRRHFAEQLAESNAKLRAIYDALEQLPRQMKLDDYKKPFLVPCVVEDYLELLKDDKEALRMIVAAKSGIEASIFGGGMKQEQTHVPERTADPSEIRPAYEVVNDNVQSIDLFKIESTTKEQFVEVMKKKSVDDRVSDLNKLLAEKNLKWALETPFAQIDESRQVEALWYYFTQPTPAAASQKAPWEK